MEKSQRMPHIYGYLVCLVAVITVIICVSTLVYAILDLGDPIHAGFTPAGSPSLASFANYKMDILKSAPKEGEAAKSYMPDDQTLRAMYEAAKDDRIQSVRHESNRTIVIDSVLILICVVLFVTHWRWMRKLSGTEA
ncbi:MAG TPA: hypothetical protein VMW43_06735 [Bacteroidota bacterium]|nr:hypothetical protein [Bacteroidota bacterium]